MRIDRLKHAYQIETRYVQFPLHPDTPNEGLTLEQLFAGRSMDIPAAKARMARLMAEEGLPYGERTMTYNSRLAQELAKWAETQPGGEAIHDALFRVYFVKGKNIANIDVLLAVVMKVGLSVADARQVLESRSHSAAVDADWQRAAQLGITGVPTYVAGNNGVVGAQPYEVLEKLVLESGGTARD